MSCRRLLKSVWICWGVVARHDFVATAPCVHSNDTISLTFSTNISRETLVKAISSCDLDDFDAQELLAPEPARVSSQSISRLYPRPRLPSAMPLPKLWQSDLSGSNVPSHAAEKGSYDRRPQRYYSAWSTCDITTGTNAAICGKLMEVG